MRQSLCDGRVTLVASSSISALTLLFSAQRPLSRSLAPPPSPPSEVLHAVTMIILDDPDDLQNPDKLFNDARSVVRPCTPTPSLPSYESSQALQHPRRSTSQESQVHLNPSSPDEEQEQEQKSKSWWPLRGKTRLRRVIVYALVVYFVITVAVGVPVIIVKLTHRNSDRQASYLAPSNADTPSLIADGSDAPLLMSSAVGCNAWVDQTATASFLQYTVPLDGLVFVHSNVSYSSDAQVVDDISGTLLVGVNSDPTVSDGIVSVTMHYSDLSLMERTHVCLMNISGSNGIYLYVPSSLPQEDSLVFNITFLFPQIPSLHITEFMTMLPHFYQFYTNLSPYVTFDKVSLGGARSAVSVGSIEATSLSVKTALAEIEGTFNISESLVLETVSAPINVNVSLYNDNSCQQPTFLDVSTGNAELNASVQLYIPPSSSSASTTFPNFMTKFETFNAPMVVAMEHMPDSAVSTLQARVDNSMGAAFVSLDNKYSGTFDVSTTFADADVYSSTVDDLKGLVQLDLGVYRPTSSAATVGTTVERTVELDTVKTSRMTGWVGTGQRPPPPTSRFNSQGRIEVMSTLSPVALLLES